eukprot:TRINITY_DN582_c0_g2_i7.p1 TRINITY_DN582_c0_g2~~TRINITY_DN582_c0_g2_i7.p1  ORF type:complete len:350 (+),score=11.28 TRINITY_DN582_c0_g2_i7:45-1094(+)
MNINFCQDYCTLIRNYTQQLIFAQVTQELIVMLKAIRLKQVCAPFVRNQQRRVPQHAMHNFKFKFNHEGINNEVLSYIFSPENKANGHLIMIANGAFVRARDYFTLCERLANLGYITVVANFEVDRVKELPMVEGSGRPLVVTVPNMHVLQGILKSLVNHDPQTELPLLQFTDVVLFGHSWGGLTSLMSVQNPITDASSPEVVGSKKYADVQSDPIWDEYVKGVIVFEVIYPEEVPLFLDKFFVIMGSEYWEEIIQNVKNRCGENSEAGFHVISNCNHFLVNDFHGEKQVTPTNKVFPGQEDFVTTKKDWEEGQKLLVSIVDAEIRLRLDSDVNAKNLLKLYNLPQSQE